MVYRVLGLRTITIDCDGVAHNNFFFFAKVSIIGGISKLVYYRIIKRGAF